MKPIAVLLPAFAILLIGCGPTGPLPVQSTTVVGNNIVINYDPNQRTNEEMRTLARGECKKRGLELKDVTVSKTTSTTTSQATVFCG